MSQTSQYYRVLVDRTISRFSSLKENVKLVQFVKIATSFYDEIMIKIARFEPLQFVSFINTGPKISKNLLLTKTFC